MTIRRMMLTAITKPNLKTSIDRTHVKGARIARTIRKKTHIGTSVPDNTNVVWDSDLIINAKGLKVKLSVRNAAIISKNVL